MHPKMAAMLEDEGRLGRVLWMAAAKVGRHAGMEWDDLKQEARIHLWKYAGNYEETGGTVDGFVYRVAYRGMVDAVRRAQGRSGQRAGLWRSQMMEETEEHGALEVESEDGGYEAVDARLDAEVLLAGVSERDRKVVEEVYGSGRTMAAVGESIGLSESRVCQIVKGVAERVRSRKAGGVAVDIGTCSMCKEAKVEADYSPSVWAKKVAGEYAVCRKCQSKYEKKSRGVTKATFVEPVTLTRGPSVKEAKAVMLAEIDRRLAVLDGERARLAAAREAVAAME